MRSHSRPSHPLPALLPRRARPEVEKTSCLGPEPSSLVLAMHPTRAKMNLGVGREQGERARPKPSARLSRRRTWPLRQRAVSSRSWAVSPSVALVLGRSSRLSRPSLVLLPLLPDHLLSTSGPTVLLLPLPQLRPKSQRSRSYLPQPSPLAALATRSRKTRSSSAVLRLPYPPFRSPKSTSRRAS